MLGWAVTFLIIALVASSTWIRRHRRGISGNCESFVLSVSGDVHNLFYLRLARQRCPMIGEWRSIGDCRLRHRLGLVLRTTKPE
jgi:hypothetical protein